MHIYHFCTTVRQSSILHRLDMRIRVHPLLEGTSGYSRHFEFDKTAILKDKCSKFNVYVLTLRYFRYIATKPNI